MVVSVLRLRAPLICGDAARDAVSFSSESPPVASIVGLSTVAGSNVPDRIGKPRDRRKLIAVLYADMVGYSRLIGLDDAGTLERLRTLRSELIDPAIEEHGGRIVQTGGDSLLIVFDSIDGAVRCAVKMQQQVPIHDGDQPPDRAIRFRIGINIGDAIADGTDLHGDAVNVAAGSRPNVRRVVSASRGRCGIMCRTGSILPLRSLGALKLKNIARPVEAFVLRLGARRCAEIRRAALVYGTAKPCRCRTSPRSPCWPFTNMSGDPEQEYFSDGIADDIITELRAAARCLSSRAIPASPTRGVSRRKAGRARTGRALRAGGQRAPQQRSRPDHCTAYRCRDRQSYLGRALRPRPEMFSLYRTRSPTR